MTKKEIARAIARVTVPRFIEIEPEPTRTKRIKQKHYAEQNRGSRLCLLREQQRLWDLWHRTR